MLLKRFWRDRSGGVAPMLALAALPVMGFVGAAIDFSRAASVRTAMQAALDSTALMLSKEAQNLSPADLNQKANDYFQALFTRPEAHGVQITQQLSMPQEGSFVLKITGSGSVDPVFTKLLGQTQLGFAASAEVLWGIKKLNLALVLDNTGSMSSSGKMTNLKVAAHNLLTTLQNAAKQPGDVQVAIVPFAVDVNVGTANVDASWIDWTDWEAANGTCSSGGYTSKSSCTSHGKIWTPASHSLWNGCVNDRDQNNDVSNTAPLPGSPSTKFRAHQATSCPAAMMPLSHDWAALNGRIDAMTPTGNTNVTIGLGLPALVAGRAVQRAGARARPRQGHRDPDRRREHAEPLDLELDFDQRADPEGLRQHQGREHHALYGACDRRQRHAAEELRHQAEHVLRRRPGHRAHQRVLFDRPEPGQSPHRQIAGAPAPARWLIIP